MIYFNMQHANTYVHMRIKLFYMDLIFFLSSVDFLCNMGDFVNIRHLKYIRIKCLLVILELCNLIQLCGSCFISFLFVFVRVFSYTYTWSFFIPVFFSWQQHTMQIDLSRKYHANCKNSVFI